MAKTMIKLHNAATVPGDGVIVVIPSDASKLSVVVSGTSTSFTCKFMASHDGVVYIPISGSKSSDITAYATSTATIGEGWEFDVSIYNYFKAPLGPIANGNVTATAIIDE